MSRARRRAHRTASQPIPEDARRGSAAPRPPRSERSAKSNDRRRMLVIAGVAVAAALVGLFVILETSGQGGTSTNPGSASGAYQVGQPAVGATAPDFTLPSTAGGTFSLSGQRGKTVLLYFQEGIGCEPCWQQIKDIESSASRFHSAGVDEVVSITTNDLGQLQQKASDEGIRTPVLSDSRLTASHAFNANMFGMMGQGADGHSFILVGPDGRIRWRADYGGAPNYTMYVPVDQILRDMHVSTPT